MVLGSQDGKIEFMTGSSLFLVWLDVDIQLPRTIDLNFSKIPLERYKCNLVGTYLDTYIISLTLLGSSSVE